MVTGLIIGKFYPFHLGHMYLVDVARSQCDRLTVWVCDKAQQEVLGTVRAAWIRELYPDVDVRVVPDTLPDDDSAAWAHYTVRVLGKSPDVVFTSEDYGPVYARLMGSRHVMVDRFRSHVSVSGTAIRNDAGMNWEFLAPPVRAHYAKRIVVVGAESTGTTTLTRALADHYQTAWVPEYGREYTVRKFAGGEKTWTSEEFVHIAAEQRRREDEAARHANRVLFCDTDAFATTVWHERYVGLPSTAVEAIAAQRLPDLYLLTGDEIPFEDDGLRDGEHIRHDMHRTFAQRLAAMSVPHVTLTGSHEARMRAAQMRVNSLLFSRTMA
jgi:NadR type nicotinamide-nucleotide adenylyltransferase